MSLTVRKSAPLSPLARLARTRVKPESNRIMTNDEAVMNVLAHEFNKRAEFLIWYGNPTTGEYTGFDVPRYDGKKHVAGMSFRLHRK